MQGPDAGASGFFLELKMLEKKEVNFFCRIYVKRRSSKYDL